MGGPSRAATKSFREEDDDVEVNGWGVGPSRGWD